METQFDYREMQIGDCKVELYGMFNGYWRWTCKVYDKVAGVIIRVHDTWTLNNNDYTMRAIKKQLSDMI